MPASGHARLHPSLQEVPGAVCQLMFAALSHACLDRPAIQMHHAGYRGSGVQLPAMSVPRVCVCAPRRRPASEAGAEKSEQLEGLERGWVGNGQPPRRTSEEEPPPAAGGFRAHAALQQDEQAARPRLMSVQPVTTAAPPAPNEGAAAAADAAGGAAAPKAQGGLSALEVRAGGSSNKEPRQLHKDDKVAGKKAGPCCCSVM